MIGPGSSITFRVTACLPDVSLLGISARALFQELSYDSTLLFQLELAVVEAGNNIVVHACKKDRSQSFEMEFSVSKTHVKCIFSDQGISENFLKDNRTRNPCVESDFPAESNRGICLICNIMDTVNYTQKGKTNLLTISKRLPHRKPNNAPSN